MFLKNISETFKKISKKIWDDSGSDEWEILVLSTAFKLVQSFIKKFNLHSFKEFTFFKYYLI